jgi:hypothetical protein
MDKHTAASAPPPASPAPLPESPPPPAAEVPGPGRPWRESEGGWWPQFDWRSAVIYTLAALLLTVVYYHGRVSFLSTDYQLFGWHGLNFVLLFIVPALVIRLVFREPLRDYGLTVGHPDIWGKYLLLFVIVFIPLAALASRLPEFHSYYPRFMPARHNPWLLIPSAAGWLVYFWAWEFFFRGFLLHGLGKKVGAIAIFIQMVPFVLAHLGKPEAECYAAVLAGIALGLMAWRGRSFIGAWLVHWLAATTMDMFCVLWPLS